MMKMLEEEEVIADVSSARMFELFPDGGAAKQGVKIAGLTKPFGKGGISRVLPRSCDWRESDRLPAKDPHSGFRRADRKPCASVCAHYTGAPWHCASATASIPAGRAAWPSMPA
jgi:hypothetical protein